MLFRIRKCLAFCAVALAIGIPGAASADSSTTGTAGIVFDPEGNPVADARVQIYLMSKPRPETSEKKPASHIRTVQPVQQQIARETDENGRFTLSPLAQGEGLLSVSVEPYAQKMFAVTLPDPDIRVQLDKTGGTIRGIVRNVSTGEPVPGARVVATPTKGIDIELDPGKSSHFILMGSFMRAETDAHGSYTIDRLPPGTSITLEAATDELIGISEQPWTENQVVVNAGEILNAPELKVYPGHVLTGRVLDRDTGLAIPGAQVNIGLGGGPTLFSVASGKTMKPAIADSDGNYNLDGLKPWKGGVRELASDGKIDFMFVTATAPGYKPARFTPTAARQFDQSSLKLHHDFILQPQRR